jgi:hypothetical protein
MLANRQCCPTWLVSAATSARAQRWTSLLALLSTVLPGCETVGDPPASESAAGTGAVGGNVGGTGGSLSGGTFAGGGVVAGTGGQVVGTGGQVLGGGGQVVGTGGEVVGAGGQVVNAGGQVVGSGGEVVGTGGEVVGTGGEVAGAGGEVAGAGGEVGGAGGKVAGAGGEVAGAGGEVVAAGGDVAGAGGQVGGSGAQVAGAGGQVAGGGGSGGTVVYAACPGDAADAYLGTPGVIPGTIEAEDFDSGGYSDSTAGNEGGAYRTDVDVDIKESGDGFAVGWMTSDEWLEYTVNVSVEGDYSITLRLGAVDADRTLELSQCDTSLTGPIAIPQIADWGDMATTTAGPVHLSAGLQVIRVTVGANDFIDFDSMTFE